MRVENAQLTANSALGKGLRRPTRLHWGRVCAGLHVCTPSVSCDRMTASAPEMKKLWERDRGDKKRIEIKGETEREREREREREKLERSLS